MEFFNDAKAVRLKSHLEKYLVADDDQTTVRQSRRSGALRTARWTVELVEGNPHAVRLKGCHGGYLTASDEAFLLGMTGKKVLQTIPENVKRDESIVWEPIKEGYRVRLRTKAGKYLRANGATPPWRNSITHDFPHRTATQDWVMWEVDVVDVSVLDDGYLPSNASSFDSTSDDYPSCPFPPAMSVESGGGGTPKAADRQQKPSILSRNRWLSMDHGSDRSTRKNDGKEILSKNRWLSMDHQADRSSNKNGRNEGMEFFNKAKSVRLQSYHGKYLVADEDEVTVRQSRNGSAHKARWTVEYVDGKRDRIRLKSCHGLYLTAVDEPFVMRMTGKKVQQTKPEKMTDVRVEWQPIKEGLHVKLMAADGKFLRANGGAPPWRNSVTHDVPHRTATQNWVLWGVDVVDITLLDPDQDSDDKGSLSPASSFNSLADDYSGSPDTGSPMGQHPRASSFVGSPDHTGSPMVQRSRLSSNFGSPGSSDTESPMAKHSGSRSNLLGSVENRSLVARDSGTSRNMSMNKVSGMEFFKKAKSVRLKSHHDKYLTADSDEETVVQGRSGSSRSAKWTVEFVEGVENVVRLKSCYSKYLRASDEEFLLGVTGRKVAQALLRKLDSSVEWEPIRDGMQVKLKTRYGNFLRANGGPPPWRNSVTHDIPHRHHDWILWEVDVVEIRPQSPPPKVSRSNSIEEEEDLSSSFHVKLQSHVSTDSPRKSEGRLIYYHVADDDGNVNDNIEGLSFQFKGHGLEELKRRLEEETGLEDIILCQRNILTEKLYPLRLALPPNNATMHVVVIPSTSKAANEF